jgi:hypothetical protein
VMLIGLIGFFPYISSKGVKPVDSFGVLLMAYSAEGKSSSQLFCQ